MTADELAELLHDLHQMREEAKHAAVRSARRSLKPAEKQIVLAKTGGKCHMCGGPVEKGWVAAHVLAHSAGGIHSVDNYVPAHQVCNSYRWNYLPEEFQYILKLGGWLRYQIEMQRDVGPLAAASFVKKESARERRRKTGMPVIPEPTR